MDNKKAAEILRAIKIGTAYAFLNDDAITSALDTAIAALEKQEQDRWIPVTERLPEYGTLVLTQLSDNDIVTNWVIDEEDEEWFEDDVIAWRPLPELFQEEE